MAFPSTQDDYVEFAKVFEEKISYDEVATHFNIKYRRVKHVAEWLRKNGVPLKHMNVTGPGRRANPLDFSAIAGSIGKELTERKRAASESDVEADEDDELEKAS